MRRSRALAGIGVVAAFIAISAWLFTAEARGPLPPGTYVGAEPVTWLLTGPEATARRGDALNRAAVYPPGPRPYGGRGGPADDFLVCRFLPGRPTGTSAKFNCVLDGGEVIKVKYSRNSEIHAEAAGSRLLQILGFAADDVHIVPRVRCYGCPRFPFLTSQLLSLAHLPPLPAPNGHDSAYTDFEWAAVEYRFDAPAIETESIEGWAWYELKSSLAPAADLDAFRLLAVFLAHWDNKSENQRLVCLDDRPVPSDGVCRQPVLMIQDLGGTFGPSKVNLVRWRDTPVWADRRDCTVSMRNLPYHGATFSDARISEAGRLQLAGQLMQLDDAIVRTVFRDARFQIFHAGTDDERDLSEWVAAFRHRVDQIAHAGPCAT